MSANQVINAFDLLGQAEARSNFVRLPGAQEPKLGVAWGEFRQSLLSSLGLLVGGPPAPRKFFAGGFFKDCWVERRIPRRAVVAACLWHLAFLAVPFPDLPAAPRRNSAFDNTELTWSGAINDLPLVEIRSEKPKPSPRGEPGKPFPARGADAFHPRQRILTDPVRPTHPRQMLINSAAPPEPPKILPTLPNIVQLAPSLAPARPHLEISQKTLARLRPRERRRATVTQAPPPEIPAFEQKPGEIALATPTNAPARPKLELNAGAAPRQAQRKQSGDVGPAPELAQSHSAANGNSTTFIALSAAPGPAAPPQLPQGNLSARVSISPEGKKPGVPGGNPGNSPSANGRSGGDPGSRGGNNGGLGKNTAGVSISGGNPPANNGVSGLGRGSTPGIGAPSQRLSIARPDPHAPSDDALLRTGPPNFAALPPGAKPEAALGGKKVYTLYVNMPNLNSATGSWILNFSELRTNPDAPRVTSPDLAAPSPLKKVDPKYPPSLIGEHVEGEVILYAVIRSDGTVDSIQLVRGIDEQLDDNAMQALSQWKFLPAEKAGVTVDLEAIVHIPFHAPAERY
jgi:TonB family protein